MKKRVKIIAGAVLLGVLAVAGLVVLLMPVRVETETVQKADLLDTFTVSATVTPVCMRTAIRHCVRSGSQRRRDCRAGCKDRRTG